MIHELQKKKKRLRTTGLQNCVRWRKLIGEVEIWVLLWTVYFMLISASIKTWKSECAVCKPLKGHQLWEDDNGYNNIYISYDRCSDRLRQHLMNNEGYLHKVPVASK